MTFPTPPAAPQPQRPPQRLPLMRPHWGRMLCGVCRGVGMHLGVPVALVRVLFAVAACLFGAGIVTYAFLWVTVPSGDPMAEAARRARARATADMPLAKGNRDAGTGIGGGLDGTHGQGGENGEHGESLAEAIRRAPRVPFIAVTGMALLALCGMLTVTGVPMTLFVPLLLATGAVGVSWLHANEPDWQTRSLLIGVALLVVAVALFTALNFVTFADKALALLAVLATLLAVGLMLAPWTTAMSRRLTREQALKEREEERADMAAHLHDGVLQTLALIQLHSNEPSTVFTLARSQERELREWLYQERGTSERSVSAGVRELAARIEDGHGRPVEVVTVGDARPSAQTDALLDATAQALLNAVTHGGEPISVYCEAGPGKVEVFVRDHGDGFDVQAVPPDRLGIRESIVGRIRRRGGSVEIVSRPGWGTEVRMHMPIGAPGNVPGNAAGGGAGAAETGATETGAATTDGHNQQGKEQA